ncbi:LamG-like jellyroll fold domain-containing protein [Nocardioides dilutus]
MNGRVATLAASVTMTLVAGTAWAYWTADSTPGGNGATAATSVNPGAQPTASAVGQSVTVSWAASTLANGQPVAGYLIKRFDSITLAEQTIGSACAGVVASTSCVEANVPGGTWRYSVTPVIGSNWRGAESTRSSPVVVVGLDITPPTNNLSLSSVTGGAFLSGTTVFYRGTAAGSFRITNAVADAGSGPASSQTAALTGTASGWTHSPSTVSTPAGGPYVSNPFSWNAGTASNPGEAVTGRDVAGNTAVTNLSFSNDSAAPTAGTITYADGFASGRSVSVSFTTGTDTGSGIATRRLQRAQASLNSDQTCGTFGAFNSIGADAPTSPYLDGSLASACYMYRYVVTDRVGNQHVATSANVAKIGYAGAVNTTTGLLSHWRLGEASASLTSSDSFTGSTGALLTSRTGEIGASWALQSGTNSETISAQGQAYRNGAGYAIYRASGAPSSADYSVEADLVVKSSLPTTLSGEMAGVIGRLNTATNQFYMARWEEADNSWNIVKFNNGSISWPNYVANQPDLLVDHAYRVRLEMSGGATTTLRLYVNGVLTVTATDSSSPYTGAGVAGIMDGNSAASTTKTSTTGLHFENFQVTPASYPRAADSKGTNTGDYKNGVTLGAAGALAAGTNTAATFDGVNDYVQMTGTTGIPTNASIRSTELWFKTSSSNRQVLFRYGSGTTAQEYGLWINAGGTAMTAWGWGGGNDIQFTLSSAVNDGNWHHVVKTYDGTSLRLYVDGAAVGNPVTVTRSTVMDQYGFGIGAVIRPNDGNSGGYFQGSIDEVSFYTSVLTQTQVTDHYQLGGAPPVDASGPTGGSIDATGLTGTGSRYSTSTTLSLAFTTGTDPSGIATSGNQVLRATATLTNGVCGTFGSSTLVTGGNDPSSPLADTVADQACFRYEYVVQDTVGNATTYTSPDIKVDTTAPTAPTLTHSAFTNTYWSGSGTTVYYRSNATTGSFTTTASASDSASGIASYTFPSLGTNWTSTPGALGVNTYSWTAASPAPPDTKNVTASNNAGLTSANAPFTMTADNTAPTAGTISYTDGSTSGTTVSVSFTTGTDGGSGVGTRLLQRASAPLTGITCGTYGAFTTVTNGTNPTSPVTDTIAAGSCYKYQYVVRDNVGNEHVASSNNVAHTAFGAHWTFDEASGNAADSTGNGNTATLQAGASRTAGKVGANALNLTGATNSWASTPAPVIDTSQSYTVTAWARPSSLAAYHQTVVALDGNSISPFFLKIEGGQYLFAARGSDSTGSTLATATGVAATAGTWAHLAAVHDNAANTISLYVNGVLRSTVAFNSPWTANGVTAVGRAKWNGANVDFFTGAIDDVRLYDRPLSASEIDDLVPAVSYFDSVQATAGLLSHYRLGETTTSADAMAGTAGATLQSRNGETGAAWTKHGLSDAAGDAVLTSAGRLRKGGSSTWNSLYHASGVPASPDYTVEADFYVASHVPDDRVGVVGRMDPNVANGTYYLARYEQVAQKWILYKRLNGSWDWLGEYAQTLTQGATYRLALDMNGTTIRVLVDGVQRISVTDGGITDKGFGGVSFGFGNSGTTITNTTGYHLDNFRISPPLADSKGTNHGDYFSGVTLGVAGAISGDSNTAATFDGSNDFGTVTRQIADDFSIEFWFKSTQNFGSTCTQWWQGAGLVDAEVGGMTNDFGVSLCQGKVIGGVGGTSEVSVVSGALNNGAWHHVVFTRTRSTGALALYVDGVSAGTATGGTTSLTAPANINFGRLATGTQYYAGSLDEVAIYNTVLTAGTVADHYAAGTP